MIVPPLAAAKQALIACISLYLAAELADSRRAPSGEFNPSALSLSFLFAASWPTCWQMAPAERLLRQT